MQILFPPTLMYFVLWNFHIYRHPILRFDTSPADIPVSCTIATTHNHAARQTVLNRFISLIHKRMVGAYS